VNLTNAALRAALLILLSAIAIFGGTIPGAAMALFFAFFDSDSATLSEEAKAVVSEVAARIKELEEKIDVRCTSVTLAGHADGAEQNAKHLSLRRAEAVGAELRRLGIPGAVAINVRAVGATEMMVNTAGPEPYNRRVFLDWCPNELREWRRRYQQRYGVSPVTNP
jgi:hypothetical protein